MAAKSKIILSATDRISGIINKITSKFPKLDNAITKTILKTRSLNKAFKSMGKGLSSFGGKMRSVGRGMVTNLTLPAGVASVAMMKTFADYERALIGVGKTTNLQGKELEEMGDKFKEMSKHIPLAIKDLLGLGQAAAQMGVPKKDVLAFAETLGKLQFATDIQGEEGALALGRILKLSKGGTATVKQFGNALTFLGNTTAATESEILGMSTTVAASIGRFNVSGDRILGISAAMKDMGIQSEKGGTQIGFAFEMINKSLLGTAGGFKELKTVLAKGDLKKFSQKELLSIWKKDPTKVFLAMAEGLAKIDKNGKNGNFIQVLDDMGLKGARAAQVFGPLVSKIEVLKKKLADSKLNFVEFDGALDKEAEAAFKSMHAKYQIFKNSITRLSIELGKRFKEPIEKFFTKFSEVMDKISKDKGMQNILLIVGGIALVLGPAMIALGLFLAAAGPLLPLLGGLATVGVGAFAFIFSIPGLITIAVIGAIAAIVVYWKDIKKFFIDVFDWISGTISKAGKAWDIFKSSLSGAETVKVAVDKVNGKDETGGGLLDFFYDSSFYRALNGGTSLGPDKGLGAERKIPGVTTKEAELAPKQKTELEITIKSDKDVAATTKTQGGFDILKVNRGFQGVA